MAKQAYFQGRCKPEELAMLDCIMRRAGFRSRVAVIAFLVNERYRKMFGNTEPDIAMRSMRFLESDPEPDPE